MSRIPSDDDNDASSGADPESVTGGDELSAVKADRDSLYERLARATAEFKNSQKRQSAEMDQRLQYANGGLIKSLLPVIDNFERALAADPAKTDVPTLLKGMQIVHDQWLKVLKDQNVEEIAPKAGDPFDPSRHEAIMQQESDYTEPTVVQLFQKGYALHDRTLRPAQVAVSKSS